MREAIVGSFDVLIARGGHATNRIMTVLTLTSVILLPGALLAAVMGMNFKVGLFNEKISLLGHCRGDHRDRAHHGRDRQGERLDLGGTRQVGRSRPAGRLTRRASTSFVWSPHEVG